MFIVSFPLWVALCLCLLCLTVASSHRAVCIDWIGSASNISYQINLHRNQWIYLKGLSGSNFWFDFWLCTSSTHCWRHYWLAGEFKMIKTKMKKKWRKIKSGMVGKSCQLVATACILWHLPALACCLIWSINQKTSPKERVAGKLYFYIGWAWEIRETTLTPSFLLLLL